ncbi:MAG: proline racemase family protein [Alphaproteobacteria bacterium]
MPDIPNITTVDSHTGGHPTRVVTGGLPKLQGETVADKMDDFAQHHDHLRTFLLHEPRGHAAMVGAVLTESTKADFGAFFLGSYNYLPMCGHATIGLAVTLDHLGLIQPKGRNSLQFDLEVPAGIICVSVRYQNGRIISVGFKNVPAFVVAADLMFPDIPVSFGLAYGGNWYALVEAGSVGVNLSPNGVRQAMDVGSSIKFAINAHIDAGDVPHMMEPIHSVLFHQGSREAGQFINRQLVVLAPNKFDRSPCGTGTSARLAQLIEAGEISSGERIVSRNILDVDFMASATPVSDTGNFSKTHYDPVIEGLAHITGTHCFIGSQDDPLADGFLCN